MTLSEALSKGLEVTATGLIIVFSVLVILMVVMMLMKVIFNRPNGGNGAGGSSAGSSSSGSSGTAPMQAVTNDDSELIAVLTAAVAACLNTSTYNLNIKSFRRIINIAPDWQKAGLSDVINARY